jgi:hypothetical protein
MKIRSIAGAGAALALTVTMVGSAPALANEDDVIRTGQCTGNSDWKVKASPEDNGIELEGEVDSNKNGQTWRWRMKHNGHLARRGTAVTHAPSGSFDRERLLNDAKGVDHFVFRAKNPATGEVCRGTVSF